MKTILCYGDSNTYGFVPGTGKRYDYETRWTGRLQLLLGHEAYYVIEEGLNGRTTVHDDSYEGENKNGQTLLPTILGSHWPLDLIIIMLGSNDLKLCFQADAKTIAQSVGRLVAMAKAISARNNADGMPCSILVIAPPSVSEGLRNADFYDEMGERAISVSKEWPAYYEQVAQTESVFFLDAAQVVQPSPVDGLHLTPEAHAKLAQAIAEKCRQICPI